MTNKNLKRIFILLIIAFIFSCLTVDRVCAKLDSAHVSVTHATCYPGRFVGMEVKLQNDVQIAGFQFRITLSNPELINFHTDSIRVDTIVVPVDTCTGPEPHGDSCFVDSLIPTPVRYCFIDTVGSLISNFDIVQCHGDTSDTSSSYCKFINILGMAKYGQPIPTDPNYRTLFRFGVDVFCLSDTVSDRTESFYMFPGTFNFLSDPLGDVVPFDYKQGDLTVWWSVPGDANGDSLVDLGDITYLLNFLYRQGPAPCIPETGDVNGDCNVELGDIVSLLVYLFREGPPPLPGCWHGKKEE